MAHFAEINNENIVTRVIVINNNELIENDIEVEKKGIDFCESLYGHRNWVQTSYNKNFRYNFAGIGFIWDEQNNAFYRPQPYESWTLDENYIWQPPTQKPNDQNLYIWDENTKQWLIN